MDGDVERTEKPRGGKGSWGVVHLYDPYFTIWPRVAGRLEVAYRQPR